VIDSYRRRWGLRRAWIGTQRWPQHVGAAKAFGDRHSEDRYIEIRYEELAKDPRDVMQKVVAWLGEPWDERVLAPQPRTEGSTREESIRHWAGEPGVEAAAVLRVTERPNDSESEPDDRFKPSPFSSSIGIGSRGKNRLINAPFYMWLDLKAADLVRDMGYAKSR
jgi:Sulfotransferase family